MSHTPEQRLRNLASLVIERTTPTRRNVGRPDNFAASKQEIADAARQLAEEIIKFLDSELDSLDDQLPF